MVDQMFGVQNFNDANGFDSKYADKLLTRHQQEQAKQQDPELKKILSEEKNNANNGNDEAEAFE